jgi:hypothetical protein
MPVGKSCWAFLPMEMTNFDLIDFPLAAKVYQALTFCHDRIYGGLEVHLCQEGTSKPPCGGRREINWVCDVGGALCWRLRVGIGWESRSDYGCTQDFGLSWPGVTAVTFSRE